MLSASFKALELAQSSLTPCTHQCSHAISVYTFLLSKNVLQNYECISHVVWKTNKQITSALENHSPKQLWSTIFKMVTLEFYKQVGFSAILRKIKPSHFYRKDLNGLRMFSLFSTENKDMLSIDTHNLHVFIVKVFFCCMPPHAGLMKPWLFPYCLSCSSIWNRASWIDTIDQSIQYSPLLPSSASQMSLPLSIGMQIALKSLSQH